MVSKALANAIVESLPVLFVNIGWAVKYDSSEAVIGNHGYLKEHPDGDVSEGQAFLRDTDGLYYSGVGRGRTPEKFHIVFAARDPADQNIKVVGFYAGASATLNNEGWAFANTRFAERLAIGKRPLLPEWPEGQGIRRWAIRQTRKGSVHRKLRTAFIRLLGGLIGKSKARLYIPPTFNKKEDVSSRAALMPGTVYTRDKLRQLFAIRDATLDNGVFPHLKNNEVWLFVTESKSPDRTQYRDRLKGDQLSWQGQTAGRTDNLIVNHAQNGYRLLVFYRRSKYEFAGAGFRLEGQFGYVRCRGTRPTTFTLRRVGGRRALPDDVGDETPFDPKNAKDAREELLRSIRVRRGQQKFRALLLHAYDQKCAFTGCEVLSVLEAAHISPYLGTATNKVTNGLLLRADLHTLFDSGLINVHPDKMRIGLDFSLKHSEYWKLHGKKVRQPLHKAQRPSKAALEAHRDQGLLKSTSS